MSLVLLLAIGGGLAVAFLIVVLTTRRGVEEVRLTGPSAASAASSVDPTAKIEAIKRYREKTGVGLKEAKEAIEAMERGDPPPMSGTAPPMSTIAEELRAGRKINAIKLYREQTGVGLKEAKDAIDAMEREL